MTRRGLGPALEGARVVICCGSGGVGKTTAAAAIGLRAAVDGARVVVVTIDPAKRLADAFVRQTFIFRVQDEETRRDWFRHLRFVRLIRLQLVEGIDADRPFPVNQINLSFFEC